MFNHLSCCLVLLAIAISGPAEAQQQANQTQTTEEYHVTLPGTDYEVFVGRAKPLRLDDTPRQALLVAIETWLSSQFNLPNVQEHPRIEFVSPAKIAALRFNGLRSNPGAQTAPNDQGISGAQYDTVAVYYDFTHTIYLPESWTGDTAAALSVLVHEVVHHFQNVLGHKHECPQEREKLAYLAQERWLGLFGHSLESDFDLDPFSLLVKTKCFY
jgi:hypothetical protein